VGELIPLATPPRTAGRSALAMAIFLGSWSIGFVALFIGVVWVRARAVAWPPAGAPELPLAFPTAASVVVLLSSTTAQALLWGLREGRPRGWRGVRGALTATHLLGLLFLALQLTQWTALWRAGLQLRLPKEAAGWAPEVAYAGSFYFTTAFHAVHVVAALLVLGWLSPALWRGRFTARSHQPVRYAVWFWHFVTVAWFGVWALTYLF